MTVTKIVTVPLALGLAATGLVMMAGFKLLERRKPRRRRKRHG